MVYLSFIALFLVLFLFKTFTKCLKNQQCDVIKFRNEKRSGKETPKKEMDNPSFLCRHIADFLDTL